MSNKHSDTENRHAMVGPAHLWRMKRDFQIQFLKKNKLKRRNYLLDIGCGTLRGGMPLIKYLDEGHYFGIEVREEVLDEGRKELQEGKLEDKKPTLIFCPDISQLEINQKFEYIWAFAVLIHMTDNILDYTLDFVKNHLSDDGVFLASVNVGDNLEGNWQGFPVVKRPFEFYTSMCAKNGLTLTDIGSLKELGHDSKRGNPEQQRMLKIVKDTNIS